jgi:hypothetical protein
MKGNENTAPTEQASSPPKASSEEIARHLEQFSIEVLEAALLVLQTRQAKPQE